MMLTRDFRPGDLVWFDPGVGYVLPGEVVEFHKAAQVITVQAVINNITKTFTLNNLSSVKTRQDLGANGVEDMITLSDLNEASMLWNLRIRYDNQNIYTYIGSILVAVNPYRMFDIYGLDTVSRYEGRILGTLPPHLFAMGATAYNRLLAKDGQNQVMLITGESGAGKTESTKLLMQYLAAVNKSSSNLITEQILEASPLLESFGNSKTLRNDNSSRFGKYLEVKFNRGIITGAKVTQYLLEKSRIVTHAPDERNYHIFYEMLAGLPKEQKDLFGLMSAEKYFYLNQGGNCSIDGKTDREDFETLMSAMQVLGFSGEERDTIFKILASILHLGNVYFHRKQLKHGQEGVEIGSDAEIKWAAHLLQLNVNGIKKSMTTKTIMPETRNNKTNETVQMFLNIDQALDARDAIAKSLYSTLFTWLVTRVNKIIGGDSSTGPSKKQQQQLNKNIISILDIFGFEDFVENSFEQLCINFANESLQYFFNKHVFKLEQAEYAKEKIEWTPISFTDNQAILHMLAKKPVGIFHLLDDESNFPKASDLSFLEKCHYNHALNELYSRPRMSSMEFGIKHFAGQVWYNVEGFLDKNRDTLRYDVMGLLIGSKDKLISKMFLDLRNFHEATKTLNKPNGQFITVKPRTPTVAARFHDSLNQLLATMSECHPWYIRCIKPNSDKCPMKFDMPVVLEQLRYTGMLETVRIRKTGYAVRLKYQHFGNRYRCLLKGRIPRGAPTKEISRVILDNYASTYERDSYALGSSKVFLRESLESVLEKTRQDIQEIEVLKLQRYVRGYLARKRFVNMKRSAITIQSAYRGYVVRKKYSKVKKGVVALQAIYRMKKQQSIYGEMKTELQRRQEAEREARERARHLRATSQEKAQESPDEKSPVKTGGRNRAVASVNHLEIPAELAFVLSKLDAWEPVNTEKSLAKVSGQVPASLKTNYKLPHDIDYYVFSKWTNIYFKSHLWQMKREPIKTPFLSKSKESDYHESLAIFKLILRFMNDSNLSGRKEKVLGDYIINKGIQNEKLRDEIFCQLANQTWKNDNEENCERGWLLLSNCLSAFPPSRTLYKYLLKYVSDHGYDGYKALCQQKLLKAGKFDSHTSRQFPPTVLEWRANKKRVNLALEGKCSDGDARHGAVDSFTTAEEFAANILQDRGIVELQGWTVSVEEGGDTCAELNGGDFVLDGIGELELPPAFPANKGMFLVTTDRARGRLPLFVDTEMLLNGPQGSSGRQLFRHSASPPDRIGGSHIILNRNQRAQSQDRILVGNNNAFGLSGKSALNERYFEEKGIRSKSLDNLIEQTNNFGLSESRLNQRYLSHTVNDGPQQEEDANLGRLERWDNIGLSKTPLNDRYFSQPDLGGAVGNTSYEDRSRSSGNLKAASAKPDGIDLSQFEYPDDQNPNLRRHGHPRFVKGGGRRRNDRSSAMSDTSEAPSVASHVRRVRVPSQASDVDQFLDDLFMPVLDGNMDADGLSDARSLAASMRGGGEEDSKDPNDLEVEDVLSGNVRRQPEPVKQDSVSVSSIESQISTLCQAEAFLTLVKGGGNDNEGGEQKKSPPKTISDSTQTPNIGFQPIPGLVSPTPLISGMISPPPMLVPTPISGGQLSMLGPGGYSSISSPILMGQGMPTTSSGEMGQAVAFTYVPVPVYNMAGIGMSPHMGVLSPSNNMTPNVQASEPSRTKPHGTSTPLTQGVGTQSHNDSITGMSAAQLAYQQAFLQNAVAQNMQIQQQLMMQNQALSQLLNQSGGLMGGSGQSSWQSTGMNSSMTTMMGTPMPSMIPAAHSATMNLNANVQATPPKPQQMNNNNQLSVSHSEALRRASMENLDEVKEDKDVIEIKQRSMSTPSTPKQSGLQVPPQAPMMPQGNMMDPYTRARTVRIGKWRWPPPKEEMGEGGAIPGEQQAEGFFEFKMRKMQQKMSASKDPSGQNHGREDSFDTSGEIQRIDWEEDDDMNNTERKRKQKKQIKDPFDDDEMDDDRAGDSLTDMRNGNVGKLKLSSEMKEKLEAVTGSRKNSIRSNASSSKRSELEITPETIEVRKLSENRKMLMEQKLGGGHLKKWNTVDEVHRTVEIPEAPNRKSGAVTTPLPPPPPPPPLPGGLKPPPIHLMKPLHVTTESDGPPSPDSSSFYSPDGSLPDPRGHPPTPIKPLPGTGPRDGSGFRRSIERRGSDSTHQTEKTEKFELEESSEFLEPVDRVPVLVDENDYAALEEIKTKVHPPASNTHFAYNRVPWTLKIKKEVFSPSETLNSPLAINLVFCQIVTDVFSPLCIRFSGEDRSRMKTLLDEYEINLKNIFSNQHKLSTKKNIIDMAKELPCYFARLYPVSSSQSGDIQYLAVSHSGVRLVRREKSLPTDYLQVLDTFYYEDIGEVSTIKKSGLQLVMHTGGRVVLSTPKAGQIKDLLNQYIIEASSGQYDYVKALAEFSSRDESALNFKKGDIIAVVPKHDAYTEKGWLYGIKDGNYGLFPSDFVERMSPQAIRREMRIIAKVTRSNFRQDDDLEEIEEPVPRKSMNGTRGTISPLTDNDFDGHGDPSWESGKARLHGITDDNLSEVSASAAHVSHDGKNSLLEFAMRYFRGGGGELPPELLEGASESLKKAKFKKKKSSGKDWTWKDQVDMVKWTDRMINNSLLRLEPTEMNKMALECFACIMRYMGDLGLLKNQTEVDCVNTILMYCHKFEPIRDEVYCQIMKQTTNNKSPTQDSCQKGWRLFSIIAAYFTCSVLLKPYLFKYLESSAYDKRRAYHGTALVCLHNLRKTFKYGGRKNVPSIEEITAISAGRNSKRQIYRLPGGTERVINTKSTTVVTDIIEELCNVIGVNSVNEREEFSLYCIVEGETFTVPLAKDHYILDVTTELQRDGAIYYLIFCRSVWHYQLRLDNPLYIEVVFNQIAPDYLEGLLLVMPGEQIDQDVVYDIAKVASLLHRAADMDHKPTIKETKFLLPKPALSARDIKPPQWVNMVQSSWEDTQDLTTSQAKAQVLEILSSWPLFGSSFFAVRRVDADLKDSTSSEHILALNRTGVSFLDLITHETLIQYPFTEVISTRKVQTEDGTLFLDMKCGNLMQQRITRIQTEQANEIARLIRQYITIDQKSRENGNNKEESSDHEDEKINTSLR